MIKVFDIVPDTESYPEGLGISQEDARRISRSAATAVELGENVTHSWKIALTDAKPKDEQELFLVAFELGRIAQLRMMGHPTPSFMD